MSSHRVDISLEVKGNRLVVRDAVEARLRDVFNLWFTEEPMQPPYPDGALLHYTIRYPDGEGPGDG